MKNGEVELLELLNSAPVIDGRVTETLGDPRLRSLRDDLHAVIRGQVGETVLSGYLEDVVQVPEVLASGLRWKLSGPEAALSPARMIVEWSRVEQDHPGRLRACANEECNKFLIDHSKSNSARWCSMAECGNRMKARRHHSRQAAVRDRFAEDLSRRS